MKASDVFVRQLEEEGVKYLFGLPGEENLDLIESIRQSSKIRLIVTRHEQAAAFMAATYGRLTGKAGVCLSTLGPGATNLVTGVAHAQLIGAPLVSISGQKALRDNWQALFQHVDVVNVMKPITKKSVSVIDPNTIPSVIREAFKLSETERAGAVHIELPEDVAGSQTGAGIQRRCSMNSPAPSGRAIKNAVEMIRKARHPLIIVSSGANRRHVAESLIDFINRTGIYIVHTQMGKGVVPADNQHSLFATGIHKQDYVNCGIDRSDLIIAIGYNIVEYPPSLWNKNINKKILSIDYTPSETDRYFNPDLEVIGDISTSLKLMTEGFDRHREFPAFKRTRDLIGEKINEAYERRYPPLPQEIVHTVRSVLSSDDIVTLDNGIYKLWFSRLYRAYRPLTFILDNALATMGAGLPSGIVAKMLNPDRRVLAVCGDGGFMMNSQELETAVRYNVPLVTLILNDNAFGFIKWKQKAMGFPDFALDYGNPDFVAYANSYGAEGFKVKEGDNLGVILDKAFSLNRVSVVECPIDYSLNYDVFSKELESMVCEI
jgi:acetolactate synthase-1/2/3 large subunit